MQVLCLPKGRKGLECEVIEKEKNELNNDFEDDRCSFLFENIVNSLSLDLV